MNLPSTRGSPRRAPAPRARAPPLALGACAGDDALSEDGDTSPGGKVVIGGQNYAEMQIMSEMYAALLEDAGYEVTLKLVKSRDVYAPEMQKGNVDISA